MRLAELHLRAFGHFSDVRVDLDAGRPALHVVYGHNEAGKSTTLRAVTGLFFWVYWGNPSLTTPASYMTNGSVWSGYAGVLHLEFLREADDASPANMSGNLDQYTAPFLDLSPSAQPSWMCPGLYSNHLQGIASDTDESVFWSFGLDVRF